MNTLESKQGKRANAITNGDFICVETYSGRGLIGRDPDGAQHLISPEAGDEALGRALLDALAKSRFLSVEEAQTFFEFEKSKRQYAQWVQDLQNRFGYKSKRAMFKEMICCNVELREGVIAISPTRHTKLESWEGLPPNEAAAATVQLPAGSSDAEVGAALRLGFSRCSA